MTPTIETRSTLPFLRRPLARWLAMLGGVLLLLLIVVVAGMMARMSYVPADLDLATSRLSDNGLFRVAYATEGATPPINQLHTWTLHVTTADGAPIENAIIQVDGDMPQHGHGLPTRPQVTTYLGDGAYLVEGLKFQMGGWWVMEFDIEHAGQTDHISFNLLLQP
jgi:hypothetical protein